MTGSTSTSTKHARRFWTRGRLVVVSVLVLTALVAWSGYKRSAARDLGAEMSGVDACADPSTVAQLGDLQPGTPDVSCQPWDIGTGVTGYVWNAPDPRGVVLFQHGWGDYATRWVQGADRLIPQLLSQGLSVYAFDMYGNGRSPGPRGLVDVEQAVDDHLAARAQLAAQPLPVYVLGHSLGGLVTMASVTRDQSDLAGVILLAPALKYETNAFTRALTKVVAFLAPTLPGPVGEGDPATLSRSAEAVERIERDPMMVLSRLTWLTVAGGANVSHDIEERYPDVTVPVLAIHGTADSSTLPQGSVDMVEAVGSADATKLLIQDARHNLLDDTAADEVSAAVLTWLDDRLPE